MSPIDHFILVDDIHFEVTVSLCFYPGFDLNLWGGGNQKDLGELYTIFSTFGQTKSRTIVKWFPTNTCYLHV